MYVIRNTLLVVLFIQFIIFLYVKIFNPLELSPKKCVLNIQKQIDIESLVSQSIVEIIHDSKELPKSSEYTLWNKKMIEKLNKEIQNFNDEIKKIVQANTFIKKKHILKISTSQKVEKYAKEKLGQKYAWGATGPLSFDCSGFTRDVFLSTIGIKIPRVSRDQAKVGKYVKYEALKRGDMVFFDTEEKYSKKVNHVGIYLNDGNFIHASSARKQVVITNFKKKPFYKKRFLWGRRVIKKQS